MTDVVLVDEQDRPLGVDEKHAAHRHPARLHRAVSAIVIDPSTGRLLAQRRATGKYHFGGRWSNSCCTHPLPGESASDAVHRCLAVELGATARDLSQAGALIYRAVDRGSGMVEHERDRVFVVTLDGEPRPNPSEANEVAWVDGRALAAMLEDVDSVTPWFGLVLAVAARGREGLTDLVSGAPPPFNHPEVLEVRWSEQAARTPATAAT